MVSHHQLCDVRIGIRKVLRQLSWVLWTLSYRRDLIASNLIQRRDARIVVDEPAVVRINQGVLCELRPLVGIGDAGADKLEELARQ